MKAKSRFSRVLSVILVLTMIIGVMPFMMGAGFADDDALPFKATDVASKGVGDAQYETEELVLQKVDPSDFDLTGLRALPTQGVSARSLSSSSMSFDGRLTEEELSYVEAYAEMLIDPVGIVDVDGDDDEVMYVFVWLQSLPDALEDAYQRHGTRNRDYERVREDGHRARGNIRNRRSVGITYEYSVVFSGFALEATMSELENIAAMSGVFAITEVTYDHLNYIPDPDYTTPGNAGARDIMDIADLHADNIDGCGVKVGVIDSGIDATHPDLVGALKGGYNFAPRGRLNTGGRSSDLSTPDGNHGTHVSGIIASQGITSLGVAPGVDLYMAQVFTPDNSNSAASADTTAALEAFSGGNPNPGTYPNIDVPKVDVINMSLGNDANTAYEAGHVARNNAVIAGVIVVNSAGNNAYPTNNTTNRNQYTLGSGGVSLPISVAASQYGGNPILSYNPTVNGGEPFEVYIENGDATLSGVLRDGSFGSTEPRSVPFTPAAADIAFGPYPGSPFTIQPLVFVPDLGYELFYACAGNNPHTLGLGAGSDMTAAEMNALQAMAPGSLTGKILVVNRGQNFLDYKGQALRLGAAGLIIINRDPVVIGNLNIGSDTSAKDLMIFSAPNSVKAVMFDAAQSGDLVYLNPGTLNKLGHARQPAEFSSIGPVNETAEIKPDIIAPGWSILSTDLGGGYTSMSGTSMSSPWVAGVAALVKQAYPNATPAEIKARIMNTANPDIIGPCSGRFQGATGYYFDRNGTQISVFEQGAGFVNPERAVYDNVFIQVTNFDIPTGNTNKSTFEDAKMASFSFGPTMAGSEEDGPTLSKTLTATVNGGTVSGVEVIYNHDTRYSNKNLDEAVEVFYKIAEDGKSFDVWLEINAWAGIDQTNGNLYEGYIVVTVSGKEFVLPWATRVGEFKEPESDYWLVFFDRPVQAVRGSAIQDFDPVSSQNTIYFMFEGKEVMDSVDLRYTGTLTRTWFLDFYLIEWIPGGRLSHRISVTLGTTSLLQPVPKLSDFLQVGATYRVAWGGQANAINAAGTVASALSNVPANAYNIGIPFSGGNVRYFGVLGMVMTNTRPVLTVEGETLTTGTATGHAYAFGTDEVTVNGSMYSAAMQLASDMNFYWAGYYLLAYDEIYDIDQSLNVLVDAETGWELEFFNELYGDYVPWFAAPDGSFSLTLPVNDDGYFFPEDICPSGVVYVSDAFDVSQPWILSGSTTTWYQYMLYGATASFQWLPFTYEDDPEIEVVAATLDNVAGTLTAVFLLQDGAIPEELDEDSLTVVLTVDGEEDDVLVYEGYDAETGIATWTFEQFKLQTFAPQLVMEATVTYEEYWITTSASDSDLTINLVSATPSASVDKLNGNQNRLNIKVDEKYSDGSTNTEIFSELINSNSAGNYKVGPYTVYVDTKGNDQIRACNIIVFP